MTFGTFFLPGPTEVRPEVLSAMLQPMISHRGSQFEQLFVRIQTGLRQIFGTSRPVYISTSSATGLMEAGIRCAPDGPILSLVNGAFSQRFADIAQACGRVVDSYVVPWGMVHEPEEVRTRLAKKQYAAVTVVHSETSTGALNDVRRITAVVRAAGARCLTDSVSGLGGTELHFDADAFDYVLTGSQKALALPPGLAFAVASAEFVEQIQRQDRTTPPSNHAPPLDHTAPATEISTRGVYFNLVEFETFAQKNQAPNTPAISLYYALDRQINDITSEGMPARWERHRVMADRMYRWVTEMREARGIDIGIVAQEGHRSPTITAVTLPVSIPSDTFVAAVAKRGFTVGAGYGKLKKTTFRIGHMGDHTVERLEACLMACTDALQELNTKK
jgi:aspartate aminotransferase-like enzyme